MRFDLYDTSDEANKRLYLIYDGLHYDPLVWALDDAEEKEDVTLFEKSNESPAFIGAKAVAQDMHDKNAFTDTSKFALRCLVCGKGLTGESDAVQHAKESGGHTNFAEYLK